MKIKVKDKKRFLRTVQLTAAVILLAAAAIAALKLIPKTGGETAAVKPESVTVNINVKGDSLNEKGAEELIKNYLTAYYQALGSLTETDLSAYFDTADTGGSTAAALDNGALTYLIAYRRLCPTPVSFTTASCALHFTADSAAADGTLTVSISLDEAIEYSHVKGRTSYWINAEQTFTLADTENGYKIIAHSADGTLDSLISAYKALGDESKEYTAEQQKEMVAEAAQSLTDRAARNVAGYYEDLAAYNADTAKYAYTDALNAYNREKAVDYAQNWVSSSGVVRNSAVWAVYDTYGGNCTNFVSQCLYAGGIPMDTVGDCIWKWYSDIPDTTADQEGRSPSWTAVNGLLNYSRDNSGYGLNASVGGNFYSGKAGDLIVMGTGTDYSHIVIITEVITDENGNVVDYLIASNTSDRKDYPLAAYGHNNMLLIHINGWNSK